MRLFMDGRARRLLRRLPVVNLYSVAELLLLALLAMQVARLIWALATPVGPVGEWRPPTPAVAGLPADALASFDPFFRLEAPAAGPATVTSLQLTLFGTRIDEAQGGGSAILAGPDGVQRSIAVGEEVAPGVRLKAVAFDHVTLDRGGTDEDLFLDQSKSVQPVAAPAGTAGTTAPPPTTTPVPPAPPAPAVTLPSPGDASGAAQLRQEIGFIPRIDGGRVSGVVVRPQGTGQLFRQANLREGDVITSIAGQPVSSPDVLDRVVTERRGGAIPVTVERNGQVLPLTITIAPNR
jgi:general secretion pathway protein C